LDLSALPSSSEKHNSTFTNTLSQSKLQFKIEELKKLCVKLHKLLNKKKKITYSGERKYKDRATQSLNPKGTSTIQLFHT